MHDFSKILPFKRQRGSLQGKSSFHLTDKDCEQLGQDLRQWAGAITDITSLVTQITTDNLSEFPTPFLVTTFEENMYLVLFYIYV